MRQELEGAGYRFHSQTDTEVLLRAWLHWGADCLHRLNGMWAFAIWQPVKQKLFIARDRFGVKPFYYTTQDGGFCFASEPKAILRLRPNCKKVNSRVLAEFLCWGKLYSGDASFYESVSILRAAHCGEYSVASQTLRIWRYWDYPHGDEVASDAKRDIETFAALLDDAVRLRLRSDVAVGITLSGGLDSTAILASAAANSTRSLPCFTAVYGDDRGEVNWARVAT
ncbi:MAG: asparagine synthetase B, partial [Burkholderiales bacterium]|nr:asparagine synthetase B [Burkholderiales bacterium]